MNISPHRMRHVRIWGIVSCLIAILLHLGSAYFAFRARQETEGQQAREQFTRRPPTQKQAPRVVFPKSAKPPAPAAQPALQVQPPKSSSQTHTSSQQPIQQPTTPPQTVQVPQVTPQTYTSGQPQPSSPAEHAPEQPSAPREAREPWRPEQHRWYAAKRRAAQQSTTTRTMTARHRTQPLHDAMQTVIREGMTSRTTSRKHAANAMPLREKINKEFQDSIMNAYRLGIAHNVLSALNRSKTVLDPIELPGTPLICELVIAKSGELLSCKVYPQLDSDHSTFCRRYARILSCITDAVTSIQRFRRAPDIVTEPQTTHYFTISHADQVPFGARAMPVRYRLVDAPPRL